MSISSVVGRLFYGPHRGYIFFFAAAIFNAVRSYFVDVFIDESESAPSEIARERHGLKATNVTRPIMVTIFLLAAAFAVWKMWQP
jgi:hypothetical protein